MPHCDKIHYNNVLLANWGQNLSNILIFGNSFESYNLRCISNENRDFLYIEKVFLIFFYYYIFI